MNRNIRKYSKFAAYQMLTVCAVIFGYSYEAKTSNLVEKGDKFIQRKIIRSTEYIAEDL